MSSLPRRGWSSLGLLIVAAICATSLADTPAKRQRPARKPNPALAPIEAVEGLPHVLLIGDSISIGYTLPVRELLKGEANVNRIPTNGGPTTRGLESIDSWLGETKWDVIHFNWGLHDLKYIDEKGGLSQKVSNGVQQVPPAEYEQNLNRLVERMKKTGAKLIFATTTPVPDGATGRVPGDAARYNAVALKVMKQHGVAVDDLYAFCEPQLSDIQRPANVHFSPEGSKALAKAVVESIQQALEE